ncbi:MAG: PAS domain-containing sensor histidine kinase, partial [Deltaproteobacteria bacterium]|nr:PAS domain-containing sensor histidine kinase [Deltaproteobacteria bacterium]
IDIVAEFDPSLPKIMADPEALTQVFLNLIKNSRQSIRGKGRVTVRSRVVTDFGLRRKDKKHQVIAVDVEDTGEGIDEKVLPNIFAPFFTTKPKGTGLGLALCHRIVEEHEGDIEVKSEKGKGTVFSVYLPV